MAPSTNISDYEDVLRENAEFKGAVRNKLREHGWIEANDNDDVIVDYIILQFTDLHSQPDRLKTEIDEIVVHSDPADVGNAKTADLISFLTTESRRVCGIKEPAPASSTADHSSDKDKSAGKVLSQTPAGVSKSSAADKASKADQVFNSMLNGSATRRPAANPLTAAPPLDSPSHGRPDPSIDGRSFSSQPQPGVCVENLDCTNVSCPLAHQSPAAPAGIVVDLSVDCVVGVACRNTKCTSSHESPAKRAAFQSTQPCRYGQHCTNRRCAFQHPEGTADGTGNPATGGGAAAGGGRFPYSTVMCRFKPCTKPSCTFRHAPGQQSAGRYSTRRPNVWTAGPSEPVEVIIPGSQTVPDDQLPLQLARSEPTSTKVSTPVEGRDG